MPLDNIEKYRKNPLTIWSDIGFSYVENGEFTPEYNPFSKQIQIPRSRAVSIDPVFHLHEFAHVIIATPKQRNLINYGLSADGETNEHTTAAEHYLIEIQAAFLCGRLAIALHNMGCGVFFRYLYKTCTPVFIVNGLVDLPPLAMRHHLPLLEINATCLKPHVLQSLVNKNKPFWLSGVRMNEKSIESTKLAHELLVKKDIIPEELSDDCREAVNWPLIQKILKTI